MEYRLQKESCHVSESVLEATKEMPIDLDLSLPDYCPDIEKILKCRVSPQISGRSLSGDMLELEGNALISLYYLDAKKQAIRLCEHNMPFSLSFTLKNSADEAAANIRLKTEYLNCRALSPRRVDIHGAFSVAANVQAQSELEYYSRIEGDDIEQSVSHTTLSSLKGIGQQQFSISEVLDIGAGKGSPESILRSELSISCDSVKAMKDKLMIGGEAVLHILYVTELETGAQDTMTFSIPYSQVLDIRGVSDSAQNQVQLEVMSYETTLKSEFDENSTLVSLDAKICATAAAFEDEEITIAEDAYSTEYELELKKKPYTFSRLTSVVKETFSAKDEIQTGENSISKVIDLWCDNISSICVTENGKPSFKGKMNCCMLALDSDGVPFYLERPVNLFLTPDGLSGLCSPLIKAEIKCRALSFRITGDSSLEIRADLTLVGEVCETCTMQGIIAAEAQDDRCRRKDKTAALTLYYAKKDERLWDIACAYCTSVEAVQLENDIHDDVMTEDGMILIPM